MNLRSKTVGIVSALALSITMGAGIASAETTEVELIDNTPNCTITAATGHDFGIYKWDGTAYVYQSGDSGNMSVTTTDGTYAKNGCVYSVQGTDITGTGGTAFTASQISVGSVANLVDGTDQQIFLTHDAVNSVAVTVSGAPSTSAAPGNDYAGTITFSASVAP